MRLIKRTAPIFTLAILAYACAAPTGDGGDGDGDGDGDAVVGDGDAVPGSGGTTSSSSGGASSSSGGSSSSSGGSVAGSGGAVSTATPCVEGTTDATATPTIVAWDVNDGVTRTDETEGSVTSAGGNVYVAAALTSWAATGRACVDVSAFQGVKFTISTTVTGPIFMKIGQSAADPSGHCTAPPADCYAHPQVVDIAKSGEVSLPFTSFMAPGWGVNAPFNATQVVSLIWAADATTAGQTLNITGVQFY